MRHVKFALLSACLLASWTQAQAGDSFPGWEFVDLGGDFQSLELKMGPLSDTDAPDLGILVLWNEAPNDNRIGAFHMPAPWTGAGATFSGDFTSGPLFAVGDVCPLPDGAIVPYIDGTALMIARWDGTNWTVAALPSGIGIPFDSSDCGVASTGVYLSAHRTDLNRIEIYRSLDDGDSFSAWQTITDTGGIAGPSQDGLRDALATDPDDPRVSVLYQRFDGMVRVAQIQTFGRGVGTGCNVLPLAAPSGVFQIVRESDFILSRRQDRLVGSFEADGQRGYVTVDSLTPCDLDAGNFGAIQTPPVNPNYFTTSVTETNANNNVLWGDYFVVDPENNFEQGETLVDIEDAPTGAVGGGADGCYTFYGRYSANVVATNREPLGVNFASRYGEINYSDSSEATVEPRLGCSHGLPSN